MNITTPSLVRVDYVNPAVDMSKKHVSYQDVVKPSYIEDLLCQLITLNVKLLVKFTEDNCIELNIEKGSIASLNRKFLLSNKFNRGAYIDIFSSSIKPIDSECQEDSRPSSQIKEFKQSITDTHETEFSFGAKHVSELKHKKPINHELEMGLEVIISDTYERSNSTSEKEFNIRKYTIAKKRIVEYCMDFSKNEKDIYVPYDIYNTSTLRVSNLATRLTFGFGVPFYGWFGGWAHFPDTLHTPPECSTQSIEFPYWKTKFSLPKGEVKTIVFEWSTKVRTVFASITGIDSYNWIKTFHKIKKTIRISIDSNNTYKIIESEKIDRICSKGINNTKIDLPKDVNSSKKNN